MYDEISLPWFIYVIVDGTVDCKIGRWPGWDQSKAENSLVEEEEVRELQRDLRGIQQTVAGLQMEGSIWEGMQVALRNEERSSTDSP